MRKLQLEDLSKQLGLSKTLISMVLNGKGNHYRISKKTQTKVLDEVAKLNYSPNKFAKSRRTGKSNFIGLIVADISNPFYSKIAKTIEQTLFHNKYNLMVCSSDEDESRERVLVEMMINQQSVDGLIVATAHADDSFYAQPRFAAVPTIFIDRVIPLFSANYVTIDNFGGSMEIVNHLISKGLSHIACFAITPMHLSTILDRINGYKKALETNNIEFKTELIKSIQFDQIEQDVEKQLRNLIKEQPKVDAIFTLNNHIAVALLGALRKKEFEKYRHIKISCFDDIELFNLIDSPVLSVSQPIEEIGQNAAKLILEVLSGNHKSKLNVVLPTKLVER